MADLYDSPDQHGDDESFQSSKQPTDALKDGQTAKPQSRGPLLDETDEKKVAETITKWLRDQSKARKRRRVIATLNKRRLKGSRGLQVRPTNEDLTTIELYQAPGTGGFSSIMARSSQLVERVIAHLLSDQPAPEAEPEDDSDMAKEAADVTTRILTVEGAESGFNTGGLLRRAERKAAVHGSAFLYPCVDPTGGGWRPMEIEALPTATNVEDAAVDPATLLALTAGDPRLTVRYVKPDQTLTDDPNEADRQWLPKIRVEVLTPEHVALLPETCSGIADADGMIILQYPRICELRAKFPKFAELKDEDIRSLMGWRPDEARSGVPFDSAGDRLKSGTANVGELDDQARLCTLSLYFKSHGAYPKGAYIVACMDRLFYQEEWSGMVEKQEEQKPTSSLREECLILPAAQIRQLDDDVDDDPMGKGLVDELGEIDEQRAYILNAWNDYLDRLLHPLLLLPMSSNINGQQVAAARISGDPLYFNPQGKPEQERIEAFPADGKEFFDRTTSAGNDAVGLEETAQGTEVASVTSGAQAAVVVQQAAKNLSSLKHNLADGTERFWRIVTQLIRVYYTIPMQAKYLGEDGSWRLTEWTRADLGSTRTIKIRAGTFTQLTAEQKEAKADKQLQMQVITPDQYRDIISSGIRPVLGMKENPHIVRVKRQISLWDDGPPEGWQPPQPQMVMGPMGPMPAVGPNGQPMMPVDPSNPFGDKRIIDEDKGVATLRYSELGKHQAEARYIRKPQQWRAYYDEALNAARHAAGMMFLAEQQQMQAQAAQQQVQQETGAKRDAQSADHAHEERKLAIVGDQKSTQQSQTHSARLAEQRASALTNAPPAAPAA